MTCRNLKSGTYNTSFILNKSNSLLPNHFLTTGHTCSKLPETEDIYYNNYIPLIEILEIKKMYKSHNHIFTENLLLNEQRELQNSV